LPRKSQYPYGALEQKSSVPGSLASNIRKDRAWFSNIGIDCGIHKTYRTLTKRDAPLAKIRAFGLMNLRFTFGILKHQEATNIHGGGIKKAFLAWQSKKEAFEFNLLDCFCLE